MRRTPAQNTTQTQVGTHSFIHSFERLTHARAARARTVRRETRHTRVAQPSAFKTCSVRFVPLLLLAFRPPLCAPSSLRPFLCRWARLRAFGRCYILDYGYNDAFGGDGFLEDLFGYLCRVQYRRHPPWTVLLCLVLCYSRHVFSGSWLVEKALRSLCNAWFYSGCGSHVSKVRRSHHQEIVRRMSCCQAARICSKGFFERMAKVTTLTAPSTMKIMVVAPPNGNIFSVGAKRFHCAEVLPTEACLHRVANSSEVRFLLFNRWCALQFVLALLWGPTG